MNDNGERRREFAVAERGDRNVPGAYTVQSPRSKVVHRVVYHGEGNEWNACDCMDFRTSGTGTCRHIEAVAQWLKAHRRKPDARMPANSALDVCYTLTPPRVRLRVGSVNPDEISALAMRCFDDDNIVVDGMLAILPGFVETARRLDPRFYCSGDALNMILGERDRQHRVELAKAFSINHMINGSPLRVSAYKIDAIALAMRAGRAIIADEPSIDKCCQADLTAQLLESYGMVSSVLVVCPTSLRQHWKRLLHWGEATIIEGDAPERRKLYGNRKGYSIVSYHTLANDIKALGSLSVDMLILDKVDRLAGWNAQITQAARRVDAEYALALSDVRLTDRPEQLYDVMQFVDPYVLGPRDRFLAAPPADLETRLKPYMLRRTGRDIEGQLFFEYGTTVYLPLTAEQRAIHDAARDEALELADKWAHYNFLTEKNRRRLVMAVNRMYMAADSTYLVDGHSNSGTKIAEAMETIRAAVADGHTKVAVLCRWERMARLVAEALTAAGIGFCHLMGGMPGYRRSELRRRFAEDADAKVFLGTYAACAGLTLAEASLVLNLDAPHTGLPKSNARFIDFITLDSIEERSYGHTDLSLDTITLSDDELTSMVRNLRYIYKVEEEESQPPEEEAEKEEQA